MDSQSQSSEDPSHVGEGRDVVILTGSLTINEAAEWRARLMDRLGSGATLMVDAAALTAVDTIGLQLLCSARRTAAGSGGSFAICGRSSAVLTRACEAAGISKHEIGLVEDLHL